SPAHKLPAIPVRLLSGRAGESVEWAGSKKGVQRCRSPCVPYRSRPHHRGLFRPPPDTLVVGHEHRRVHPEERLRRHAEGQIPASVQVRPDRPFAELPGAGSMSEPSRLSIVVESPTHAAILRAILPGEQKDHARFYAANELVSPTSIAR